LLFKRVLVLCQGYQAYIDFDKDREGADDGSVSEAVQIVKRFALEVETLARLHHPNVVDYRGICFQDDGLPKFLLMELANAGDLSSYLSQLRRPMLLSEFWGFWRDVLSGMIAMHREKVIHRDIRPKNILVFKYEGDGGSTWITAKLGDLGSARVVSPEDLSLSPTGLLTWVL
jgi:eukaryotic-like serine/threonine-protein kinase